MIIYSKIKAIMIDIKKLKERAKELDLIKYSSLNKHELGKLLMMIDVNEYYGIEFYKNKKNKEIFKRIGLSGVSKMNRTEIIDAINDHMNINGKNVLESISLLSRMSITDLKNKVKADGFVNYSKLYKSEIISLLNKQENGIIDRAILECSRLNKIKEIAKERKVCKNLSSKKREELINLILNDVDQDSKENEVVVFESYDRMTIKELRGLIKDLGIKNYSKLNKEDLIHLIEPSVKFETIKLKIDYNKLNEEQLVSFLFDKKYIKSRVLSNVIKKGNKVGYFPTENMDLKSQLVERMASLDKFYTSINNSKTYETLLAKYKYFNPENLIHVIHLKDIDVYMDKVHIFIISNKRVLKIDNIDIESLNSQVDIISIKNYNSTEINKLMEQINTDMFKFTNF